MGTRRTGRVQVPPHSTMMSSSSSSSCNALYASAPCKQQTNPIPLACPKLPLANRWDSLLYQRTSKPTYIVSKHSLSTNSRPVQIAGQT